MLYDYTTLVYVRDCIANIVLLVNGRLTNSFSAQIY